MIREWAGREVWIIEWNDWEKNMDSYELVGRDIWIFKKNIWES